VTIQKKLKLLAMFKFGRHTKKVVKNQRAVNVKFSEVIQHWPKKASDCLAKWHNSSLSIVDT